MKRENPAAIIKKEWVVLLYVFLFFNGSMIVDL